MSGLCAVGQRIRLTLEGGRVADANAKNKNNIKGGLAAHSATVDFNEAIDEIIKLDQQRHIFVIKPEEKKKP